MLDETSARRHVAGMTLVRRAELTLSHFGAERIVALVATEEDARRLSSDAAFAQLNIDTFLTLSQWRTELEGYPSKLWLLARADHVYDKGWKDVVTAARGKALGQLSDSAGVAGALWMMEAHQILAEDSVERCFEVSPRGEGGALFDIAVGDAASEKRALDALWSSCRKDIDGVVSRNLNRHISLFISRRIVNLPIKPNHVTIFCIFLGLMSGYFALSGDYLGVALGAFFLKANSVIDGVDGELARVKWEFSKWGELLDSAGDNVANFSFFGALTYATYQSGDHFFGTLGIACLVMWVSYIAFLYAQLYKMKRGDVLIVRQNVDDIAKGWFKQFIHLLRHVILRRDGYVFVIFLLALGGLHDVLISVMCAGAAIPFFGVLLHYGLELGRAFSPERA
jgi:phosphatidylglycerophosphate synthase